MPGRPTMFTASGQGLPVYSLHAIARRSKALSACLQMTDYNLEQAIEVYFAGAGEAGSSNAFETASTPAGYNDIADNAM